jgi:tRNA pseudouridine55 synthase
MPTGIILLDKPQGLTSNGALQRVRKAFGAKSAGHVGTLDPMATGMLPLCLDEATKVIAAIEAGAKAYEFTVQLGARTNTGDAEGDIVERLPVPTWDAGLVESVLAQFRGVQTQVPPMYSALKREGQPLYKLARAGIEVERTARTIDIRRLEAVAVRPDALDLACECAKGTYIRVLGEDVARKLGTLGFLTRLRRTWVEPFRDMPMVSLESVLAGAGQGQNLLAPDVALQSLPETRLTREETVALRHGQIVQRPSGGESRDSPRGRVRVYGPDGEFVGLAEVLEGGGLQPRRLISPEAL